MVMGGVVVRYCTWKDWISIECSTQKSLALTKSFQLSRSLVAMLMGAWAWQGTEFGSRDASTIGMDCGIRHLYLGPSLE